MNRAEAGFLWATALLGGGEGLLEAVEQGPAEGLRPVLARLAELEKDQRQALADDWREGEGDGASLYSDDPEHVDALLDMSALEFRRFAGDFGAFQFAVLLQESNRRKIARAVSQLGSERRRLVLDALEREREVERLERVRVREVFVSLSERLSRLEQQLVQLGLYSVACASGERFRDRIVVLADGLPRELGGRLRRYYRLSHASSRRGVGRHVRGSLEEFLGWRRQREEAR